MPCEDTSWPEIWDISVCRLHMAVCRLHMTELCSRALTGVVAHPLQFLIDLSKCVFFI